MAARRRGHRSLGRRAMGQSMANPKGRPPASGGTSANPKRGSASDAYACVSVNEGDGYVEGQCRQETSSNEGRSPMTNVQWL